MSAPAKSHSSVIAHSYHGQQLLHRFFDARCRLGDIIGNM